MVTRLFLLIVLISMAIRTFAQPDQRDSTTKAKELLKLNKA